MLTLSLLLTLTAPAFAELPPPPPSADFGADDVDDEEFVSHFDEIASEIGLNGDQQSKLRAAFYDSHMARIDVKAKKDKAELELKKLLAADTVDEKAVNKSLESALAADGDLKRNRVQLLIATRKIVTLDQWHQLVAMRHERRGERRARRNPPPGGPGGAPPTPPAIPEQ